MQAKGGVGSADIAIFRWSALRPLMSEGDCNGCRTWQSQGEQCPPSLYTIKFLRLHV